MAIMTDKEIFNFKARKYFSFATPFIFVLFLLLSYSNSSAQVEYIEFQTAKAINEEIHFQIDSDESLFIEWNNGTSSKITLSDEGEVSLPILSSSFKIVGKIFALNCSENQLTRLDASNCTQLQKIDCSKNELRLLNVKDCSSLKKIDCSENQLFLLELSSTPNIEEVYCSNNQLKNINLSSSLKIKELICSNNLLNSLDLSKNSLLEIVDCSQNKIQELNTNTANQLIKLNCSNNSINNLVIDNCPFLVELDFSNNKIIKFPQCKSEQLLSLKCNNNQITEISLENFKQLILLHCNHNLLENLELHSLAELVELSCSNNKIPSLNLENLKQLKTLDCSTNSLDELSLSSNPLLETLICNNNKIGSLLLENVSLIKEINCSSNKISSLDLINFELIESLDCANNSLSNLSLQNCKNLSQLNFENNKNLETVILKNCPQISDFSISNSLLQNLEITSCPNISTINCEKNRLSSLLIENCKNLETLICHNNKITSLLVKNCKSLNKIECYKNHLSIEATKAFVNHLDCRPKDAIGQVLFIDSGVFSGDKNKASPRETEIAKRKNWNFTYTRIVGNGDYKPKGPKAQLYTITLEPSENGLIFIKELSQDLLSKAVDGMLLNIVVTPNKGYELESLLLNGEEHKENLSFEVNGDATITAIFRKAQYKVDLEYNEGGSLGINNVDLNAVEDGTLLKVNVQTEEGYKLESLTANGRDILDTKEFIVIGPTKVLGVFGKDTSIKKITKEQFFVYPNPAKNYIFISGASPLTEIKIYSLNGEYLMQSKTNPWGGCKIDISRLANGLYFIESNKQSFKLKIEH